jgi:hypothetical protein
VGQATDQAKHQVELTRVALAADIDKLERRIRAELDWKARLRRDAPQIIAITGVVVLVVVGGIVLRRAVGKKGADGEEEGTMSLDELSREVRALRDELGGKRRHGAAAPPQPLWQKVAVRAATGGAAAGASLLARRLARQGQDSWSRAEADA